MSILGLNKDVLSNVLSFLSTEEIAKAKSVHPEIKLPANCAIRTRAQEPYNNSANRYDKIFAQVYVISKRKNQEAESTPKKRQKTQNAAELFKILNDCHRKKLLAQVLNTENVKKILTPQQLEHLNTRLVNSDPIKPPFEIGRSIIGLR